MSTKTRNIIAITVAAVALAAVVTLVVLACITVNPLTYGNNWLKDYTGVEVYYGGRTLNEATDADGKLIGDGNHSGEYSMAEILDSMNFSLFSACIQFNYGFGLSFEDSARAANNEITVSELKEVVTSATTGAGTQYSFLITVPERDLELKDDAGKTVTVTYDTVLFTVTQDSDWARNLTAYAYLSDDLGRVSVEPGVSTKVYYKLRFGAKTSTMIDMLDRVYGIESGTDSSVTQPDDSDETDDSGESAE